MLLLIGILSFWGRLVPAQAIFDYANGWYSPGQSYLKLLTWQDGIYRISGADIRNAGLNFSPSDIPNLQLFFRGQEQHIHVELSGGDLAYLEFFGLRNDGKIDSSMYRASSTMAHAPDLQPIERLSLYTDTAAFFLTVGPSPGLRVTAFSDFNYNSYNPEQHFRYESYHHYEPYSGSSVSWNSGGGNQYDIYHALNSYFVIGEGYVGQSMAYNSNIGIPLSTPHAANVGIPSTFSCRIFGRSSWKHILEVKIDGNRVILDSINGIYIRTRTADYNLPLGNAVNVLYNPLGTENNFTDNNNYCWSSIRYSRLFNMDGQSQIRMVEWQKQSNAYLRFTNTGPASEVIAWDRTNHQRSIGTGNGNNVMEVVVPGRNNRRDITVAGGAGVMSPLVASHSLSNLSDPAEGAEFVIITHPSLLASANAYKQYRDTCSVNRLSAKVVTMQQIVDEFGHGSITPMAIKRFCKYTLDQWTTRPKYFLLWGKGQYETRNHPNNLVMTFGDPATDYEFVSDFDNRTVSVEPEVPIGRVNAYNEQEGYAYLEKVKTYEHTPWASWMKNSVYLGGGNDTTEQNNIFYYLNDQYRPIWEGAPLGGTVNYYQKYNTSVITNSNFTATQRINEGASIIHFFGHSSSNIYDVDIQEPVLYQNFGKMPLMVAFGCYGGNFASNGKSFGERFVLQPERGSIGYLANSTAGYLFPLGNFGIHFYGKMMGSEYGKPIGQIIKASIGSFYNSFTDMNNVNHCKQLNLQGDPSIRIYSPELPDLSISEPDVFFTPQGFSASDSSITANVIVRNLARATQDSCFLVIRQMLPGTTNWIVHPPLKIPPVSSLDTFSIEIRNTFGALMAGMNMFEIHVDATALIAEYREDNNRITTNVLIPGNTPAILYPPEFAVVPENPVKLAASAYVMSNQPVVRYYYEIDSLPDFSSPFKRVSPIIVGTAAYSEWLVPATLLDSGVYYWRVRLADVYPATWANSSFKHIVNRRGWAQSRPPQFFKDPTVQIEMNPVQQQWEFDPLSVDLAAYTVDYGHGVYRLANGAFSSILPNNSNYNGVLVTPIRQADLIPAFQNTTFGDWTYYAMPDAGNDLTAVAATMNNGDYLLVVSEGDPRVNIWPQGMQDQLQSLGADITQLRARNPGQGFILLLRKGFPGQAIQLDNPNVFDNQQNLWRYDLRVALNTNHDRGQVSSTTIGPASSWQDFFWDWKTSTNLSGDDLKVSLYASTDGVQDSLVQVMLPEGTYALSSISAARYPYLRLVGHFKDSLARSAPQLNHWHVIYTPAPEAMIEPTLAWNFDSDTLIQGESGSVDFTVRNISDFNMDSLLVKFAIRRADRSRLELGTQRYAPLQARASALLHHDFTISDLSALGAVAFIIEINPDRDQPEQYHFNNLYEHRFFIREDIIQPILDVTVDGKHLMNGDIVSPLPEILIEVNDENPFLAVTDTSYEIHFGPKTPNPNNLPRVFISGNDEMETVPATLPANKAKLYFRPERLADGEYTLRVQGFDHAGNAAGKTAYEVNFKVINESSVSNVLNYPNPFSTSTRFVYTLTGAEIPELFQIHIFTITGKMVKVIDLHETQDVRIGYNMTDYQWDGRDMFGDLLANGVYIYKVVTKSNGKEIKLRDEGVSGMFDNGYGKMYIMR